MTFTPVPVLRNGQLEGLAQDCPGFSDEEERLIHDDRKTIFIAGASAASQGRAAYCLGDKGERVWLPNCLTCFLNRIDITTQQYERFDPREMLIVHTTSINGDCWSYRTGFDSHAASSLLSCIKAMSPAQLAERVQLTLVPKGRATFINMSTISSDQTGYCRVRVPDADVGRKLGYSEQLDIISYFHLSQTNGQAALNATPAVAAELEPTPVEAEVIEAMAKPKRPRRKSKAPAERQV